MTTDTNTRFAALFTALVMTAALSGGTLFMFDHVSQASQADAPVVALQTVTITAKRV